jgi:hypothetical protein
MKRLPRLQVSIIDADPDVPGRQNDGETTLFVQGDGNGTRLGIRRQEIDITPGQGFAVKPHLAGHMIRRRLVTSGRSRKEEQETGGQRGA